LREAQWRAILDVLNEKMSCRLREAAMHPDRVPESTRTRKLRLFLESIGEKQGRAEGKIEGKREALLMVLEERDLPLTEEQRAHIEACTDIEKLTVWHRRAITAASVDEVLARVTKPRKATPSARRPRPAAKAAAAR
jgi:hypothetical protein